jgi:hypothetical protein
VKTQTTFAVLIAVTLALGACSPWSNASKAGAEKAGAETAKHQVSHAIKGRETATGSFKGLSNHMTTGTASIIRSGDTWTVSLGSDFTFDGAPDPYVAFGNHGKVTKGTNFAKLKRNKGAQAYPVPAALDVGDYLEVYLWCKKFSVPLGVARLALTR